MKNKIAILVIVVLVVLVVVLGLIMFQKNNNVTDEKSKNTSNDVKNQEEIILENKELDTNSENYPITLETLIDIPLPNSVTFYQDWKSVSFGKETYEYKKIISLNNDRNDENLSATKGLVDIDKEKVENEILEYNYGEDGSIYFNILDNENSQDNIYNYVWVKYDNKVLNNFEYTGLEVSKELNEYLRTLI